MQKGCWKIPRQNTILTISKGSHTSAYFSRNRLSRFYVYAISRTNLFAFAAANTYGWINNCKTSLPYMYGVHWAFMRTRSTWHTAFPIYFGIVLRCHLAFTSFFSTTAMLSTVFLWYCLFNIPVCGDARFLQIFSLNPYHIISHIRTNALPICLGSDIYETARAFCQSQYLSKIAGKECLLFYGFSLYAVKFVLIYNSAFFWKKVYGQSRKRN